MLNKLLQRQIQKHLGGTGELSEKFMAFLKVVSESYDHYEKDRKMLERSIELSSNEMIGLNDKLRQEKDGLKQAHHELNTLFENIEEVFFTVDMKAFRLVQMSAACEKIYGYTSTEFFNDSRLWKEVIHPDDRGVLDLNDEEFRNGRAVVNQYRIIRKDGTLRWVEARITPTLDEEKTFVRMDGVVSDITAKVMAEQELRESEKRYRLVYENPFFGIALGSMDGIVQDVNAVFCKTLGYEASEMRGMHFSEFTPPEDVEKEIAFIRQMDAGKLDSYRLEKRYFTKSRTLIWVDLSVSCVRDEAGEIQFVIAVIQDITAKRKAENSLKETNERYELVTRATKDIIWDWDIPTGKMYRSASYTEVFGYECTEGNIYGESWITHIHYDDRGRVLNSIVDVIENPGAMLWECEYRYYRRNRDLAYVQDRGYIIRDADGKPVRVVGAMRDITREKVFTIEREKITSDLIQRNTDLEQFAYIISHNLRTPVTNILGLSNILHQENLGEDDRQKCINGIVVSVEKLDEVVFDLNRILQVRREIEEKRETVRLDDLVTDIKTTIDHLIRKEDVLIVTDFTEAEELFTLKSYIHSIFYNLISNSIKYSVPGIRPVIRISSRRHGDRVALYFSDNGMGIDLEMHGSKLFGLYKKFHVQSEGKGMGLYMVKTQVEMLGGKIDVKSGVNKGTEFHIEFEAPVEAPVIVLSA